jgi:hypothetical protein
VTHQEVFLNGHEVSVISELFDYHDDKSDEEILQFYFDELGSSNESQSSRVFQEQVLRDETSLPGFGPGHTRIVLTGQQSVKKYRSETSPLHDIFVMLVLVRLTTVKTDILLSFNIPSTLLEKRGLSRELFEENFSSPQVLMSLFVAVDDDTNNGDVTTPQPMEESVLHSIPELKAFSEFAQSYTIKDWGLFSPAEI